MSTILAALFARNSQQRKKFISKSLIMRIRDSKLMPPARFYHQRFSYYLLFNLNCCERHRHHNKRELYRKCSSISPGRGRRTNLLHSGFHFRFLGLVVYPPLLSLASSLGSRVRLLCGGLADDRQASARGYLLHSSHRHPRWQMKKTFSTRTKIDRKKFSIHHHSPQRKENQAHLSVAPSALHSWRTPRI